jgi:hypothetical protein
MTASLLVNVESTSLSSYFLFIAFFALATFCRSSGPQQYKSTLQAFQLLVMILSCLAVVQLIADIYGVNERLTKFDGLLPEFLLGRAQVDQQNIEIDWSHFMSNGIFLAEPSFFSQVTALGILIEILVFGRPRYLLIMIVGFLLSYSGTGSILLAVFLPLVALRHGRAGISALLVVLFAASLVATGIINLSAFSSRVGEFEDTQASGFSRFVAPYRLAAEQFQTESAQELLLGHGPGTAKVIAAKAWYTGGFAQTWVKIFDDYGIIGSFILCCFLACCLRKSSCPGLVIAAIIVAWIFLQGLMTIIIPLCTLHRLGPWRDRRQ